MSEKIPAFEIGLVMAGAVSAGAYTAGVLDFLLQALDVWEADKERAPETTPLHQLKVRAMSGASAGSISAALLAALTTRNQQSVTSLPTPPEPGTNLLYDVWVSGVSIERLLETHDLNNSSAPLRALLDVSVLDELADAAFAPVPDARLLHRPYFDKSLHVLLSITNLRGIPYSINFSSGAGHFAHELLLHADHMHFIVGNHIDYTGPHIPLNPFKFGDEHWQTLKQSALASSAFPGGLAPRLLKRDPFDYDSREWSVASVQKDENGNLRRSQQRTRIPPKWPKGFDHEEYKFLCVDGGLMNNEPLELARNILAGVNGSNPRAGEQASRAMLMIDPFPDPVPFSTDYHADEGLLSVLMQMFNSLKFQARFKPEELILAAQSDIFSRFMIAPSRDGQMPALASSALSAFGGFFSEAFRQHDFQLGRRNCQRFLSRHFSLPESNPLFRNWTPAMRERFAIYHDNDDKTRYLPIVPLMDEVRAEIQPLPWPNMPEGTLQNVLRPLLLKRLDVVVDRLLPKPWHRLTWSIWYVLFRHRALHKIMKQIETELRMNKLL